MQQKPLQLLQPVSLDVSGKRQQQTPYIHLVPIATAAAVAAVDAAAVAAA